jgi:FdrA protein
MSSASSTGLSVHRNTYLDSLRLMECSVTMDGVEGVAWAGATMATARGFDDLAAAGFSGGELDGLGANDLVLAVKADDDETVEKALAAGRTTAFAEREGGGTRSAEETPPWSIAEAKRRLPDAAVAVISVPGEHAALETHHALSAGLHVLLFSDGVPLDEEIELKKRATELGLLVMGPGAGTAVLGGTGLGFANVLGGSEADEGSDTDAIGVVAAAGTGAQEVSALLDRWGVRVSHVIGVGGRDLSEQVDGLMAKAATRTLLADDATRAVLLVSKPPAPRVARAVLAECGDTDGIAVFLGIDDVETPGRTQLAPTLERGAVAAAQLVGASPTLVSATVKKRVTAGIEALSPDRTLVRGLFSGGTLCYEAQVILSGKLGPVHSNEPLHEDHGMPAPDGAHVLLDLGAEEYTRGVPHPMIDPSTRLEMLRELRDSRDIAVVLLDVVIGHGAHADPAGELAPVLTELLDGGKGPQVVTYVLGTEGDPQVYSRQRATLEEVGCIVPETNARAAYAAAALVKRDPALVEEGL